MSLLPGPPGRPLWKNSRWPSRESAGPPSRKEVLRGATFTGVSQGQPSQARRVTQMSLAPTPPARTDAKYRLSPSCERDGWMSFTVELTTGPRFTGVDHSEFAKEDAEKPEGDRSDAESSEGSRSDTDLHASSRVRGASKVKKRGAVVMEPPCRSVCALTSRCPSRQNRPTGLRRRAAFDRRPIAPVVDPRPSSSADCRDSRAGTRDRGCSAGWTSTGRSRPAHRSGSRKRRSPSHRCAGSDLGRCQRHRSTR